MQFNKPVSHEAFMQRALYDPSEGYYATRAAVGKSGDFSTSATLSPAFAEAIANWAKTTAERLSLPTPSPLIELGPGNGALAKGLSDQLPDWPLHLVETSEPLCKAQAALLQGNALTRTETTTPTGQAGHPSSERRGASHELLPCQGEVILSPSKDGRGLRGAPNFHHHADLKSALKATNGVGIIVANEFIDAFPAVKLRWQNDDWCEVGVQYLKGQPQEILAPLERDIDADAPAHPKEGETIYVQPSFHGWLKDNIPSLKQGSLLFIDYGAEGPSRECRAYAEQERYEGLGVYQAPGTRDITCDVNFTDLTRWCQQLGLKTQSVTTQAEFLKAQLDDFEARKESDEAFAFLSAPFGAGGAFKVLSIEL